MPLVKILIDYGPAEGWKVGEIVDISNPTSLIEEGKVELYKKPKKVSKKKVVSDNADSEAGGAEESKEEPEEAEL